jgi:hypothetical protein
MGMKKFFLLLLILGGVEINLLCQIQKGDFFVGGEIDFDMSKSRGLDNMDRLYRTQSTFELSPDIGYFISNKLAIGSQVSFIRFSQKYFEKDKFHENSYLFSVFTRYYLYSKLFSELNLGIGIKTWNTNIQEKFVFLKTSLNAGYSLFLSKAIALEPIVSIGYSNESKNDNDFHLDTVFSDFSIRLIYFFPLKP